MCTLAADDVVTLWSQRRRRVSTGSHQYVCPFIREIVVLCSTRIPHDSCIRPSLTAFSPRTPIARFALAPSSLCKLSELTTPSQSTPDLLYFCSLLQKESSLVAVFGT
ncbi:hypothetical protein Mapa_003892 [Marchantia paleacea]|nr:hypothetical protein Mapa_003892 [Marchantia paleacea]